MWSNYFTSPTFWLIITSIFVILFVFAFCCCLCCRSGDYPGKIIEYPEAHTDWQPSAPDCPPQHTAATYYPSVPGASSACVDGPYVAMMPGVNISDVSRPASVMDPASVPPPSYAQVMQANQVYYSPQGPACLPGPHGPHRPSGPYGLHESHGPPGARPPAPYGTPY